MCVEAVGLKESDPTLFCRSRRDVQTCTSWKAPVIWEGMFDPDLYDQKHKMEGSSVALTVFAVGRFVFCNNGQTVVTNCCLAPLIGVNYAGCEHDLVLVSPPI